MENLPFPKNAELHQKGATIAASPIITGTSVKVNVSMPEAAARAAATGADGVGLLRIEHLIIGMNKTPSWYIKHNKQEQFITELMDGIRTVLDAFRGKSVWVRTLDSPTDEFLNMEGGEDEPHEHNPMLGFRGIRRDLRQKEQLRMQAECFRRLWEAGYHNLGNHVPPRSAPARVPRCKRSIPRMGYRRGKHGSWYHGRDPRIGDHHRRIHQSRHRLLFLWNERSRPVHARG